MSEKYIRQNINSCNIVKNSKTYAKIAKLDDAIFIRDLLIENDWNLDKIPQTIKFGENYLVLAILDGKIHLIAKYKSPPSQKTIDNLVKKYKRNPNNSKYGLNITKVDDLFVVKKRIAGDDYIFGYYDDLEDAVFVRNFLLDHNWNVNEFDTVNYCDATKSYKVVKVFDDRVYVLNSSKSHNFDLDKIYQDFLAKICKNKYGLANYPHLNPLKDSIEELESEFGVKTADKFWSFSNVDENSSALNEIIFNLTPFEQSVYDAIGKRSSFDEIKKSLIRYRSKNFEDKISKQIGGLIEKGLVEKVDGFYKKTNL